jgi:acetyl esterase/lipase
VPTPPPEDRSVLALPAPGPDRELRYGDHPDAVIDVRSGGPGAADRPLVVVVHGGFWRPAYDRVHVRPLTAALAGAGWTTAAVEYRRVPGRPDDTVDDVAAALALLAGAAGSAGPSDGRLVLAGHSAGGHLVLQAAADPRSPALAGVVALAPVADLRLAEELALDGDAVRAFLGGPAADRPDLDPVRQPSPATAVTVLHGRDDAIVPLALGRSYVSAHPAARLVEVEGGHFAVIDPRSTAWPALCAALSAP